MRVHLDLGGEGGGTARVRLRDDRHGGVEGPCEGFGTSAGATGWRGRGEGADGRLRRPLRLAGTTGSRSRRGRATRAGRAERIAPRPEDHVETAGAQPRT